MRKLPLYITGNAPRARVERSEPLDRDLLLPAGADGRGRACDRCALGAKPSLRTPCIPAVGLPGGLLVIGEGPGKQEDQRGEPFVGASGHAMRGAVAKYWKGPVAYDNATRCYPGGTEVKDAHIEACRGYLAATLAEVNPTRVLIVGGWAAKSVFGRSVQMLSVRKGYSWVRGTGRRPIPAFFLIHPAAGLRNRFIMEWFREDIEHALTSPEPPVGPWGSETSIVETEADALLAEAELRTHDWVTFDVETMGRMWTPDFRVTRVSVCGDGDEEPYTWCEAELYDPKVRAPLARLLSNPTVQKRHVPGKTGSNVKYDQLALRAAFDIVCGPIVGDTRLTRKLLEPEASGYLDQMVELVGCGGIKGDAKRRMTDSTSLLKREIRKHWRKEDKRALADPHRYTPNPLPTPLAPGLGFDLHPEVDRQLRNATNETLDDVLDVYKFGLMSEEDLTRYNARDVIGTRRIEHYVRHHLDKQPDLKRTWEKLILPAAQALERVEAWGIGANAGAIKAFDKFLEVRENRLKSVLDQYPDVNWDSTPQVRELLFKTLGLKPTHETKKGGMASTDKATLTALKDEHPVVAALLDYRFVTKLRGNYASGMLPHVRADGRIHPNIKLDGARSGRTSCVDPNLQNIPRAQSVEGKMARDCFVAPEGKMLLEVDYSQLELRIAAMLSGDEVMLDIFKSGVDYHLRTAQLVSQVAWGIEPEQVTDTHRSLAKSVNFGVLYGKTARTLAEEWGVQKNKAQQIVDAIMGNFKRLQKWCAQREAEAMKTGIVWTWWDGMPARYRPLFRIADQDDGAASVAKNGARNSPIQGTASDFCIASLVESVDWIESKKLEDDVKLELPVHDALMFEITTSMVDECAHTIKEIMTGHNSLGVPLEVDFKVGKAWGSMEKYKVAA